MPELARKSADIVQAPGPDVFKFPSEDSQKIKQKIHMTGVEPLIGTKIMDAGIPPQPLGKKSTISKDPTSSFTPVSSQAQSILGSVLFKMGYIRICIRSCIWFCAAFRLQQPKILLHWQTLNDVLLAKHSWAQIFMYHIKQASLLVFKGLTSQLFCMRNKQKWVVYKSIYSNLDWSLSAKILLGLY